MRRLAHTLGAADEHEIRFIHQQQPRTLHNRLEAGAAQTIHRHRRHRHGDAGFQTYVPGEINRVIRGLQNIAKDNMVDVFGFDAGLCNSGFGGVYTEIGGGNVAQSAAKRAERRAHAAEKNDVFDFHEDHLQF